MQDLGHYLEANYNFFPQVSFDSILGELWVNT